MKITLCGSIAFYKEMDDIKKQLEKVGREVKLPPCKLEDKDGNIISVSEYYKIRKEENYDDSWVWERKAEAIMEHFKKVDWADMILVLNYEKKNIKGYVGANTLMEMGLAFFLKKKIYLYNEVPEMDYKEEIVGMKPIVINQDLGLIK